jgi:acetyl esterase/lipase
VYRQSLSIQEKIIMLRLFIAVLLLLISLLVLVKAPTSLAWLFTVAITNFPYIFIIVTLLSVGISLNHERFKWICAVCSFAAFILYSLPVIHTYQRGKELEVGLPAIFPVTNNGSFLQEPFSISKMFTGIGVRTVAYKTILYKTVDSTQLTLDFYPSSVSANAPVIIVIHGGSWETGDSKQLPALNSYLANKGYNVAAINYRLAPAYKSPAPVEDTKDAVAYLTQHAAELKIDTNNIVLLGRSAGGQVALVAAYSAHNPNIKGVVAFYSPADMVWGAQIKGNDYVLNTSKIYDDFFGGQYDQVPEKFKEATALEYIDTSSCPTLIIHGEEDALVSYEHSVHLQHALDSVHVKNYFLSLPNATHACDYNINGPAGQITTYATERFIYSVTHPSWKK